MGSVVRNLSPAAQAVLAAYGRVTGDIDCVWHLSELKGLAAVLCAAADQVVPSDAMEPRNNIPMAIECQRIRAELLAIADELEAQS